MWRTRPVAAQVSPVARQRRFGYARRVAARVLTEVEAKQLLADGGIRVTTAETARSASAACRAAERIGFPVALKVASPDITHKSDIGGVRLNLRSPSEVSAAFDAIMEAARTHRPQAHLDGVAVQPMAPPHGVELIAGVNRDPQFGPVLMCGLGGVFVEVLRDSSFRLVPIVPRDARDMLRELRGFPLLVGARGPRVDLAAIERLLLALSALAERRPDILELDLNPVLAYADGVLAVDARALIESGA